MSTINYGIDLGTTNSLIAKFQESGEVEVFKNPVGHKETLPSVVCFRPNRVIIGDKAREYVEKDPQNVVSFFKRKMGTNDLYKVKNLDHDLTPIELSAYVLKELKNFIYNEEVPGAAIVTVPAAFDTIQLNATKKAGYEAGFDEVLLLQEPIAACLAFANKNEIEQKGNWLVYDLGGGTFDIALVQIDEAEMKVMDHLGDNYLGGHDFDQEVVKQILIPHLSQMSGLENIEELIHSSSSQYQKWYYILLHQVESVKKELSVNESADLDVTLEDEDGNEFDLYLTITREQFNQCIAKKVKYTIQMMEEILQRNELSNTEIKQIVLVGGSTYIPYVRESIEKSLGISINTSLDPITAVVVGAAHFAGSKKKSVKKKLMELARTDSNSSVQLKLSYMKNSRDPEEMLLGVFSGDYAGKQYRIVRSDQGFDSGLCKAKEKITETLLLVKGKLNVFELTLFDDKNNPVPDFAPQTIEIVQGNYNVNGQPLPYDICLEVDDLEEGNTKLEVLFEKNDILPLKKTVYKEISRTIRKNSGEKIIINILEGDRYASPSTNLPIGLIEIDSDRFTTDMIKGSDLQIDIKITESRDLEVSAFFNLTDQEFQDVFNPSEKYVSISRLKEEARILRPKIRKETENLERTENFELANLFLKMEEDLDEIIEQLENISEDQTSDRKYQLEEQKRRIAQKYDTHTGDARLTEIREEYLNELDTAHRLLDQVDLEDKTPHERDFEKLVEQKSRVMKSRGVTFIRSKVMEVEKFGNKMYWLSSDNLISYFIYLASRDASEAKDPKRFNSLVEQGNGAMSRQNYKELKGVIGQLYHIFESPSGGTNYGSGGGFGDFGDVKGTGIS